MRFNQIGVAVALAAMLAFPAVAQSPQTSLGAAKPQTAAPMVAKPAPATGLVDINSASPDQLDALPGIGKPRATAIIKGRPYSGKDDLLRRKILTANVYNGIKDKIIAKQK